MADFNVIDANTGQHLGHVSEADLDKLPEGARVATAEEDARISQEEQYGGIRGQAQALVGGALRALPGGVEAAVAAGELMGRSREETLADFKAGEQVNPGLTTAGQVGGAVAGAATLGTAGLETSLGARLGGGALARTGASALVGAGEGAAFDVASEMSEASIENRELSAEQIMAALGTGALIGGGIGGAIAGVSGLGRAGMRKLRSAVDGAEEGAQGFLSTAINAPEIQARQLTRGTEALSDAYRTIKEIGEQFEGAAKLNQIAKRVNRETGEAAIAQSRRQAERLAEELDRMHGAGKATFGKRGRLKDARDIARKAAADLAEEGDAAKAFMKVDSLKRELRKKLVPKDVNLKALSSAERRTYDTAWDMYHRLQGHLEDSKLWGEAADLQRNVNKSWAQMFDTAREEQVFRAMETRKAGALKTQVYELDPRKLEKLMTDPRANKDTLAGISRWAEDAENFAQTMRQNADLAPDQAQAVAELSDKLRHFRDAQGKITRALDVSDQIDNISAGAQTGGIASSAAGFMLGSMGPAGAPLAFALNIATDPRRAIQTYRALRGMAQGTAKHLERLGRRVTAPRRLVERVTTATTLDESRRRRLERDAERAAEAPQAGVAQQVRTRLSMVQEGAPNLVDAVADKAELAANYLAAHAPKTERRADVVGDTGMAPTDEELETFDRRRKAVHQPMAVLDKVTGEDLIMAEEMDALSNVYPELLMQARLELANSVADAVSGGRPLPYAVAYNISTILGAPVDPIDAPDVLAAIQQRYAEAEAEAEQHKPRQRAKAPELAEDLTDDAWMKEL